MGSVQLSSFRPGASLTPLLPTGKTAFVYYALAVALSEKSPVAWCISGSHGYLFVEDGVEPFRLSSVPKVDETTLFLFDETAPGTGFYHLPDCYFVVQVTASRGSPYSGWAKQRIADFWVMGAWSREELDAEVTYRRL